MPGIPVARVVAVIAELDSGKVQVGSGYLLDASSVLTAWQCAVDHQTGRPAARLRVIRASDGAAAEVTVGAAAPKFDMAMLAVVGDPPWGTRLPNGPVAFGRVDREQSGELLGCEAVGFPGWRESTPGFRDIAEVYGVIRVLEGIESQRLVLRDVGRTGPAVDEGPAWAGFGGAAVFYDGLLLGVIIGHREASLEIRPVDAITQAGDADARQLTEALGIGHDRAMQPVVAGRVRRQAEVAGEEPERIVSGTDPVTLSERLTVLRSAVLAPSGILAATYGSSTQDGHSLVVWNVRARLPQEQVKLDNRPVAARFTQDESALIVATRDGDMARVLRIPLNDRPAPYQVLYEAPGAEGIAISRDSRTVVIRRAAGLLVFDAESGTLAPAEIKGNFSVTG